MATHTLDVDGRALAWHEEGPADAALTIVWHHGTPNTGHPPAPLIQPAADRGMRWISIDRPGYGGSDSRGGRRVKDVAEDIARIADAAGADTFVTMGHSGGGPHALATAALLPGRVLGLAVLSGVAPFTALGTDWWTGMATAGTAELKAAVRGGDALRELLESSEYDPEIFTPGDHKVLNGDWSWFETVAAKGVENGVEGFVADDLAYVAPWGFDVADVAAPTLIVQGTDDRMVPVQHGRWFAENVPGAEYWERNGDGHLMVMRAGVDVLDWLRAAAN
jgi:pimeloyl-ACP methyl ester carboxylesterase